MFTYNIAHCVKGKFWLPKVVLGGDLTLPFMLTLASFLRTVSVHSASAKCPASVELTPSALAKEPSREALHMEIEHVIEVLSGKDEPFSVHLSSISTTQRRNGTVAAKESELFDDHLELLYTVRPVWTWKALRKYKKFTSMYLVVTESTAVTKTVHSSTGDYFKGRVRSSQTRLFQAGRIRFLLES